HEAFRTCFSGVKGILSVKPVARVLVRLAPFLMHLLSVEGIQKRVRAATNRHAARTSLFDQFIVPAAPLTVRLADVSGRDGADRDAALLRIAADEQREPFDLAKPPLMRATLVKLGDQDHVLILVTHHLVSDGWSLEIIRRELAVLYDCFSKAKPSPLRHPAI